MQGARKTRNAGERKTLNKRGLCSFITFSINCYFLPPRDRTERERINRRVAGHEFASLYAYQRESVRSKLIRVRVCARINLALIDRTRLIKRNIGVTEARPGVRKRRVPRFRSPVFRSSCGIDSLPGEREQSLARKKEGRRMRAKSRGEAEGQVEGETKFTLHFCARNIFRGCSARFFGRALRACNGVIF